VQLAQAGGGNFAHISDSSMALTTFVNFISSFKSTSSAGRVALTFQGVSIPRPLGSGAADEKEKDKEVPSKTSGPLASRTSPAAGSAATAADDDKYCLVKVKRVYGSQPSSQASSSGPAAAAAFHRAASNGFVGDRSVAIDLGTVQKGDDQPRSVVLDLAFNPSLLSTASGVDALVVTANAYGCGGRNNKPSKAMITLSVGQILDAARSAKVVTATAAAAPTSGEVIEDLPAAVVDTSAITTFSQLYDHEAEVARLRGHYIDSIRAIVKEAAGLLARGDGGKGDDLIKPCREKINSLMDELQQPFPQALSAPALTRNAAPGSTAAEDARKEASLAVASDPRVASLRQNIYDDEEPERGQVGMAFKKVGWLEKWGLSYLQSFLLAHSRALCTNFKDISLQSYAGKACNKEKEGLESSLSSLLVELVSDAIKHSQQELDRMRHCYGRGSLPSASYSYGSAPAPALSASSVTSLYDARGGCFSGDSTVTRTDEKGGNKETIPLAELKAGMTVLGVGVRNGGEYPVKVRAVLVRRAVPGGPTTTFYDKGDGLKLTPWHPYAFHTLAQYHPLQWAFPDVLPQGARRIEVENADLYNVVLEEEEMGIAVGKGMCATLGHGITPASLEEADDGDKFLLKALSHPYYGDRAKVLADIERLEAQQPKHKEKGQLESKGEIRDAETNLVVGIV
jgi:Hint-domain/VWA / Hh  protein intein-like